MTAVAGASVSGGVTCHGVFASSGTGGSAPPKLSAQHVGFEASNRVSSARTKRKFEPSVQGDAKEDQRGLHGASMATPAVCKAPLAPVAKKPLQKVLPSILC